MPNEVGGVDMLPIISLIAGILILIKADLLNWVVALFMIGFGVLGILPALGVDVSPVMDFLYSSTGMEDG